MKNPFTTETIPPDMPMCDRAVEMDMLREHAANGMNVVLISPRRYGKTSMVRRVQHGMRREGACTVYVDLFESMSVRDVAERLARRFYAAVHEYESLLDKGRRWLRVLRAFRPVFTPGPDGHVSLGVEPARDVRDEYALLADLLEEMAAFIQRSEVPVNVALDEFQDIINLRDGRVESLLREKTQGQKASYFFVGSRRSVLRDIFSQPDRPFYKSALTLEVAPLPHGELVDFLVERFAAGGKPCRTDAAEAVSTMTAQYPYYAQALAYHTFQLAGDTVTPEHVQRAWDVMLGFERYGFEAIVQGLAAGQRALLLAIAREQPCRPTAAEFIARHRLSLGGVQAARQQLQREDRIEQGPDGWRLVDPVFARWLVARLGK